MPTPFNIQQLLASVRKLERSLRAIGLPSFLARLPVWWLCWYYCTMLDDKITRVKRMHAKIGRSLATVRRMAADRCANMEMLDVDKSLCADVEASRTCLWELRGYCLDIGQMFARLGYSSDGLRRRQGQFLQLLGDTYETACMLQTELGSHDHAVLELLRAVQARERAARRPSSAAG